MRWGSFAAVVLLSTLVCTSLWAAQRPLRSKAKNYPNAPVIIKKTTVSLVETFATPTQVGAADPRVRGSRIRYANRAGLLPSKFELVGEVLCQNKGRQTVEAFALTIVSLDAFHRPLYVPGRSEPYAVQQVMEKLPPRSSKRVKWQVPLGSADVYEAAVIITRVRFVDGSMWLAPNEELIDIF